MPTPIHRLYGFGITEIQNTGIVLPGQPRVLNFVSGGVTTDPLDPTIVNVVSGGGGGPIGVDHHQTDQFIALIAQTIFTLAAVPVDPLDVNMSVNGSNQQYGVDFSVSGVTLTWTNASFVLSAGDVVRVDYDL